MLEHAFRQCKRYESIRVSASKLAKGRWNRTGSGGFAPLQAAAQMVNVGFGGDGENNNHGQTQELTF